jgi:regulator of protease activity HflC (stomatin/prohibitin superfamily)
MRGTRGDHSEARRRGSGPERVHQAAESGTPGTAQARFAGQEEEEVTAFLERLMEFLSAVGWRLSPFYIVPPWEGALILRLGRYNRTLAPGFHWKYPLIEEAFTESTVVTTLRLPPQSLTTQDGVGVVVKAIVKYQIRDLRPYYTEIWDQVDVLADVTMGAIHDAVQILTHDDLMHTPPDRQVLEEVRKQVNRYGFKVDNITFTDLAQVMSIRLMGHDHEEEAE